MILLDTHVLIWLAEDSKRLGISARAAIRSEEGEIRLSAMNFWELGMLLSKRQITLAMPLPRMIEELTTAGRMTILPVTAEIAIDAHTLPKPHGDPVDRLLMATARAFGCQLMTGDHVIAEYAAAGHVRIIDARR